MIYTRDELLIYKTQFTDVPIHFEKIHDIFSKEKIVSKFWKPTDVITSEHDKIKKNSFIILNKLTLENFPKMCNSLVSLLKQTTSEMVCLFIRQMILKCANEKTYNHLYVELYSHLKTELLHFHEHFLETLQKMYESTDGDKIYYKGLLVLIINLYKKGIIKEYIIHNCCLKQFFEKKMFEEICLLFTECGKYLDHNDAKNYNSHHYFDKLRIEADNKENGMRICFKIHDLLELYENNWVRK